MQSMSVEVKKLQGKCHNALNMSVSPDLLDHLEGYNNCYECWEGLKTRYASSNPSR
jgi:hypothetical protein